MFMIKTSLKLGFFLLRWVSNLEFWSINKCVRTVVAYPSDPVYRFSLGAPNFSKLQCSCLRKSLVQALRSISARPHLTTTIGLEIVLQIKHICILVFRIVDPRAFVNLAPSTNTWNQGGRSQTPHVCNRDGWCDQELDVLWKKRVDFIGGFQDEENAQIKLLRGFDICSLAFLPRPRSKILKE